MEREHNTSKASSKVMVGSLLGGIDLKYVAHQGCVCKTSADGRKKWKFLEKAVPTRRKEQADRAGMNCIWKVTDNGAWIMAIHHCLNGTELSREESQDNLLLQYGIVPLNPPTDCDGCGKKFLVPHALSCPKGGLIMARNNYTAKEWGDMSDRAINQSCISYEPKINSSTVQGEGNGAGAMVSDGRLREEGKRRERGCDRTGNGD